MTKTSRALLVACCFVASSVLVHLAVMNPAPLLEWAALCALLFVPFSIPLVELRWRAWLVFLACCAAAWALVETVGGRPLLYAPSIVIPAALCWFFGRTLRAGRQPLVTAVALAARPATPDYLLRYSRGLTVLWTGLFAAMAAWDLGLALFAPHAAWTFMANGANYLVIGLAVGGEYLYRRLRFRDYDHPGFVEYVKIVVRADPRRMYGG
ncbi:MAG TPA: hypothetical protein VMF52_04930 [Steroidobacteraceae bacterium]|nr:hypothetical protein [Steroidobacteraceae bacterium]